jgi:hypothetical protein
MPLFLYCAEQNKCLSLYRSHADLEEVVIGTHFSLIKRFFLSNFCVIQYVTIFLNVIKLFTVKVRVLFCY